MGWTYTAEGLVTHCKNALKLKTKYMWAGTLASITDAYIDQKVRQCKSVPASRSGYTEQRIRQLHAIANRGYYGVDCVCLVKSYYWSGNPNGGTGSPKYEGSTDKNAGDMYALAKVKGDIKTIPDRPGIILISRKNGNHIGVYAGNGKTIESTLGSRGDGVVERNLETDKNFWTDWFECPYISYKSQPSTASPQVPKANLKTVTLAFNAKVRRQPRTSSEFLKLMTAGTTCIVIKGSETKDPTTNYTYIKLYEQDGWIITTSLPGGKV